MKYGSHGDYVNSKGIEVPSVTTVLKVLNKPSLVKWANYIGFKRQNVQDVLDTTSYIGTFVHDFINAYICKSYYIFICTSRKINKKILYLYFNNFISWYKTRNIETIYSEKAFTTDSFGGTLDFYGKIDGKYTILDFKTSKKPYGSMFLQLAGYIILLEELGEKVDQVGILIVNDKEFSEKIINREDMDKYITTFKYLVSFFHAWYNISDEDGWEKIT